MDLKKNDMKNKPSGLQIDGFFYHCHGTKA